jgi:Holliday junction resolvasome RuvABC ATP-dependent DNA helicase subunit
LLFGQDEAIASLSSAIKLSRAGLRDVSKTIGSFLFAGPTGVGKTEVTKQLASLMGVELQLSARSHLFSGNVAPRHDLFQKYPGILDKS